LGKQKGAGVYDGTFLSAPFYRHLFIGTFLSAPFYKNLELYQTNLGLAKQP